MDIVFEDSFFRYAVITGGNVASPGLHGRQKPVKIGVQFFSGAGKEAFPNDFDKPGVWPRGFHCSLKDADKDTDNSGTILSEKYPEYKGCYVLKANSTRKPVVVDRSAQPIREEQGIIYPGCYVYAKVGVAGYTYGKMTKGVKAYLNGVQFVKDGERFGSDALGDFDALDGDEDDFLG